MSRAPIQLPPQNLVAERSLLGSLLLENSAIDDVGDTLLAEHFYSDVHAIIYAAILRLYDASTKVDAVTLAEELDQRAKLDEVGGVPYVAELLETVPHAAHAQYYAAIVKDKWIQRRLTGVCTATLKQCYEGTDDTAQVLDHAEQGIFGILENRETARRTAIRDLLPDTLQKINDRLGKEGSIRGLATGFRELDRQTNGFSPGELVILAARPSMGKTAFVCNVAEWVAGAGETTTYLFSLEQSKDELIERFLCIRSRVNSDRLRKGALDAPEQHALANAARELDAMPLHIDDQAGRTVSQIAAICRRMKRRSQLGLVIIDYLQLIEPEDRRANREQQIAQITRRLKVIAKDCEVPIVALAQLNRGVELREDKRPRLADLRESGAIEQDADVVIFLHRPDYYNPDDQPGAAEVIVAKHRSAPTGIVRLQWRKESMRFTDYEISAPKDF